jgi:hypothetical protein
MSCPTNANRSYPINPIDTTGNPVYTGNLSDFYDSKQQSLFPIEFIWGPRATPPFFIDPTKATTDDANLDNPSTIRYANKIYTLKQAQITQPYNTNFIANTTAKTNNKADLTLLFKTDVLVPNEQGSQKYIIISIPLIYSKTSSSDPAYISGLTGGKVNGPFSLMDCLPTSKNFAAYSTCLNGTPTLNALVMIFYDGCMVSQVAFNALATQCSITNIDGVTVTWPMLINPQADFVLDQASSFTAANFAKLTVSTMRSEEINPTTKSTSVNSYKCVPLDINANIKDGAITIDTTTGKPMSNLVNENGAILKSIKNTSNLNTQQKTEIIASFILLLVLIGGLLFIIYITSFTFYEKISPYFLILFGALIFTLLGFLFGVSAKD